MSEKYRVSVQQTGESFDCDSDDVFLRAALRSGQGFSYECNVGGCGTCKFDLVEGDVEVLWEDAPGLNPRDKKRGRLLACQCVPRSDCVIKPMIIDDSFIPLNLPKRFLGKLVATRDLTADMREFSFKSDQCAAFRPGQFLLLDLPGVAGVRAYSMSNTSNKEGLWEVMIRKTPTGVGTGVLFDKIKIGDEIPMDGPYGQAYLRTDVDRTIVCIGGGSGLAPVVSIARGLVETESMAGVDLHLFYGGRGPADLCGQKELEALPGYGERLHYYPAISMPELDREGTWTGYVGFVHELVKETFSIEKLQNCEFYTAGPPPMINAIMQMLAGECGVAPDRIHYDSFF